MSSVFKHRSIVSAVIRLSNVAIRSVLDVFPLDIGVIFMEVLLPYEDTTLIIYFYQVASTRSAVFPKLERYFIAIAVQRNAAAVRIVILIYVANIHMVARCKFDVLYIIAALFVQTHVFFHADLCSLLNDRNVLLKSIKARYFFGLEERNYSVQQVSTAHKAIDEYSPVAQHQRYRCSIDLFSEIKVVEEVQVVRNHYGVLLL